MKKEIINLVMAEGFAHSFIRSLHTAFNEIKAVDLETVAGASGFAFRLMVHKDLCPSAMSVFDWSLLETGARNCGFEVTAVTRFWDEEAYEVDRRTQAHVSILSAIDQGIPVVAWDLAIPEWELITGYDMEAKTYSILSVTGQGGQLPFEDLGRREIPILSVVAPMGLAEKPEDKVLDLVLRMIVDHGEGREYCQRPDYSDGYHAYLVWSRALEQVKSDDWPSRYYIATYAEMRRLAYKYLKGLSHGRPELDQLTSHYRAVADHLSRALAIRNQAGFPTEEMIQSMQTCLHQAFEEEKSAVQEAKKLLYK